MGFLYAIVVGIIAGWLAGQVLKGKGFGPLGNLVVGIIGALVGKFVFGILGIWTSSIIGEILMSAGGAIILLLAIGMVKK